MRKSRPLMSLFVLALGLLVPEGARAADLASRRKAFEALLSEHWDWVLSRAPEFASILGDRRWNDKSTDFSAKAITDQLEEERGFLRRFEAVDTKGFSESEELTKTLVVPSWRWRCLTSVRIRLRRPAMSRPAR